MRGTLLQVENRRKAVILSVLCFSVYTVSYIGRLNYSAALTEIIATGFLSKTQGGAVATAYFLFYGAGQLLNGILADKYDPMRQVTIGVVGSVALNLLMGSADNYLWMLLIWGANGYAQSLIWAPVFLMISQSIPAVWRNKSLLLLNTASPAGAVAAYAFSGLMLWKRPWRSVFSGAALCMGLFAVIWVVGCRYAYQNASEPAEKAYRSENGASFRAQQQIGLWRMLALSGGIFLILPAMIHGMLKDGITTWLPTYMTEVFSMPAQLAVACSIFLPVINMLGAMIAFFLMRRIKNELICATLLFSAAGTGLLLLWLLDSAGPFLTILLFSVVTAVMMAVNVLLCSEVPIRFVRVGKAATVSGFYNSCGYIGTAASMYVVAYISEHFGWNVTQILWIGACIGALMCCAAALPKWRAFFAAAQETGPKRR